MTQVEVLVHHSLFEYFIFLVSITNSNVVKNEHAKFLLRNLLDSYYSFIIKGYEMWSTSRNVLHLLHI